MKRQDVYRFLVEAGQDACTMQGKERVDESELEERCPSSNQVAY
jgi:hypothetical protein